MSFEQATYSFSGGHPPTPSRTPTSDSFDEQDAFSTPKLDAGFYDTRWENNDSTSNGSFQKTPKAQQRSRELSTHAAHLLTTPNFALLSPQMPSPDLPSAADDAGTGSLDSMIQTPPPTNSSGTRRREKQNSTVRPSRSEGGIRQLLPKPSESAEPDLGLDIASPPSAQQQFSFDFGSPGMFGGSLGPVTAPVFPQQRLFWDGNLPDMSIDFSTDDLFKTSRPDGLEPFVSNHDANAVQASFVDVPGGIGATDLTAGPSPVTLEAQILQQQQQNQFHQHHHHLVGGVDPNLLFGSPGNRSSMHMSNGENLQPYAYQVQEARRERAYAGISKNRRRRKPSVDSPAVAAALESLRDGDAKPGLRRSMTDSFLPRSGRSSSSSSRAGTSHGRSSPLKQMRADTKSRTKPSVELVIGPDGRARMETVLHQNMSKPRSRGGTDVDSSAHTDETDSSETDEDEQGNQDNYNALATSFGGDAGSSMLGGGGRFAPSAGHSQKSSYSSYYSSNSDSSRSKGKKGSSKRPSRALNLDPVREGGSFEDDAMVGREAGSAQQALMQSLKASQRGRYSPQKQSSGLEPFVSAPSMGANSSFSSNSNTDGTRRNMYR